MRLKPNDTPEIELGEVRQLVFNLAGAVGVNTISTAAITSPNVTFGATSISGTSFSVTATFSQAGTHNIIATCTLSSSETIKGHLRAKVVDSTYETNGRDYG